MKIRMSKNLELWVEQIIGSDWSTYHALDRQVAIAKVLQLLEAEGDAERLLKPNGKIKWIATRRLRDHIRSLRLDAEEDFRAADEARGIW
jgi:hypothetical protein